MQKLSAEAHDRRMTWPLRVEVTGSIFDDDDDDEEEEDFPEFVENKTRFVHDMSICVASFESERQQWRDTKASEFFIFAAERDEERNVVAVECVA